MVMSEALSDLHIVHADDHVGIALRPITAGETVSGVAARMAIPKGHKMALKAIAAGDDVRKYGWPIGKATTAIEPGDHVHTHNLATKLSSVESYSFSRALRGHIAPKIERTFMGYRRKNGRVGTRNEIWILCTVGCVARTSQKIAEEANRRFAGKIDGVFAFTHPFGCSQLGDDLDNTRRITTALASHPNAGGVLILGLGCENNQLEVLLKSAPGIDRDRLRSFTTQGVGDEIEEGLAAVAELVELAGRDKREPCPVSDLVLGLKCGGSDGFSGVTANPLVGMMADRVAGAGGIPVLTEIPEIFGAEQLLMQRASDQQVFDDVVSVVNDFKNYFISHGQPIYENPSPGNVAGGITTLEEKSLGAVQKGGHATLTQVLRYGDQVQRKGLALLEAPGADGVSSTALVAAGSTVLLFTTGRGTPLGFPAPTLKIASNSELATRKPNWIDFDAGVVLHGASMDKAADDLMDLIIDTASGRRTRAEINGEREIAIWKNGVTL
jgi:altronate hydrolase